MLWPDVASNKSPHGAEWFAGDTRDHIELINEDNFLLQIISQSDVILS